MKHLFLFMAMLWSTLSYAAPSWVSAPRPPLRRPLLDGPPALLPRVLPN